MKRVLMRGLMAMLLCVCMMFSACQSTGISCPGCGQSHREDASFCSSCGTPLSQSEAEDGESETDPTLTPPDVNSQGGTSMFENDNYLLNDSVQISDGMTQTSGDGVNMAFDQQYGILFCVYMPGAQGKYGESRGRICLTYFPASQPTNTRTVTVSEGHEEYTPNIISLGRGIVRVTYEKWSWKKGDHNLCYKDYNFLTGTFTEEKVIMLKQEDGTKVPLTQSVQFAYLKKHGYHNQTYREMEQLNLGGNTLFKDENGVWYGAITTYLSEPVLFRSEDNLATLEYFAIYPHPAQYEMDIKYLNGVLYAIYRTDKNEDSIYYTFSRDNGKTWQEAIALKDSIQCRPRMIVYNGHILMSYNYYNADTGNRPEIQQGRTSIRICYGEKLNPNTNRVVVDLYSKYGIVNVCLMNMMNDLYLTYSTSVVALEYQNGNAMVRGKDAVRFVNLGDVLNK
ncbi:MAG: hypothetical protein E7618_05915 [Ruminococcaceae bacterium]|nr:hypothetical protein [Oscillospiraceae bacterium]